MTTFGAGPSTGGPGPEASTAPTQPDPILLADRYQLGEVIGRGGMAEVYRATDLKLRRPVAVKMLLDDAGDETDRARFVDEARTLAMLSHSGLVTVLDAGFGTSGPQLGGPEAAMTDRAFLAMELVEGPTLAQLMESGPMSLEQIGMIAVQVAEALAYVHARGVVHRDVKPGNVLVGPHDTVKLADFGIARLIEQRSRHTGTGVAIGTAAYVAPEQVQGHDVDGAADVYALGLVVLEAITGQREYAGPPSEAALARLSRPPEIPFSLPPRWQELLKAMTALDPQDRPAADDIVAILRPEVDTPPPVPTASTTEAETSPLLETAAYDVPSAEGFTKPMTNPRGVSTSDPRTSPIDRARDVATRFLRQSTERLRTTPKDTLGVIAAAGALVIFLIALAVVGGEDPAPDIPANTPAELREPLTDLHEAVDTGDDTSPGDEVPALDAGLEEIDAAVEAGDDKRTVRAVNKLTSAAAQALVAGDISDDEADRIFEAARDVLAALPDSAGDRTGPA